MAQVQPQQEIRWSVKNANGTRTTHIIDQGGNYKVGGRVQNPKEPKYADDYNPPISDAYPRDAKPGPIAQVTGRLESFVYFDRDAHKTVRMVLENGEYQKTIL